MKFWIPIIFLTTVTSSVRGQNFPACDTLVINCCTYNTAGPNTIVLTAANTSSVLFDYPGFVLFDSNMDTVAIETVNYFGIGTGPQFHVLDIVAPLTLPFTGYLNLYILFYDTLACSFPITLPDTTTGISENSNLQYTFEVYPNPTGNTLTFRGHIPPGLCIADVSGRTLKQITIPSGQTNTISVDVSTLAPGLYLVVNRSDGTVRARSFLKD